jgi:hypothetical protein
MIRIAVVGTVLFLVAAVAPAQLLDDFESYEDQTDLQSVWSNGELDTTTPNPGVGTQSLERSEPTDPESGWAVERDFSVPLDLEGEKVAVQVRRDPASVATTGFSMALHDGKNSCLSEFFERTDTAWHELLLDLPAECSDSSLDASQVVSIHLTVWNFTDGSGVAMTAGNFDDLVHYLERDGFESGDFSGWTLNDPD